MSSGFQLAVVIAVAVGYSSAVTWARRSAVNRKLWIVTTIAILSIALLGVLDWRGQSFNDTSLNEYFAVAVIPSLAVSLLVAWLQRDARPALLIAVGSALWLGVALIILTMSL